MKYLKKFEMRIKDTADDAINHPLRKFSEELENVIKKLDNNFNVRRSFDDGGKISIKVYFGTKMLFKIELYYMKNSGEAYVLLDDEFEYLKRYRFRYNFDIDNLHNFIKNIKTSILSVDGVQHSLYYLFPDISSLYKFLDNLKVYMESEKYNL